VSAFESTNFANADGPGAAVAKETTPRSCCFQRFAGHRGKRKLEDINKGLEDDAFKRVKRTIFVGTLVTRGIELNGSKTYFQHVSLS